MKINQTKEQSFMGAAVFASLNSQLTIHHSSPDVAALRQRLQQLDVWPDAGDQFLALLAQTHLHGVSPEAKDFDWVTVVANDALTKCDVGARYPSFFQKLLVSGNLRQAFLQELDHLQIQKTERVDQ
jgi:hypothetical protein